MGYTFLMQAVILLLKRGTQIFCMLLVISHWHLLFSILIIHLVRYPQSTELIKLIYLSLQASKFFNSIQEMQCVTLCFKLTTKLEDAYI